MHVCLCVFVCMCVHVCSCACMRACVCACAACVCMGCVFLPPLDDVEGHCITIIPLHPPRLFVRRLWLISSIKVRHKFCPYPHPLSFSCQCTHSLLRQARAASFSGNIIFPISLWLETVPFQPGCFQGLLMMAAGSYGKSTESGVLSASHLCLYVWAWIYYLYSPGLHFFLF